MLAASEGLKAAAPTQTPTWAGLAEVFLIYSLRAIFGGFTISGSLGHHGQRSNLLVRAWSPLKYGSTLHFLLSQMPPSRPPAFINSQHSFLGWPCLLTLFTLLPTKNIFLPSSTKDTHTSLPFMLFLLPERASLPVYPALSYTAFKFRLKGHLQGESLSSLTRKKPSLLAPHFQRQSSRVQRQGWP